MKNIINFPELNAIAVVDEGDGYLVSADISTHPQACQYCSSKNIKNFGSRDFKLNDIPHHGKSVLIKVSRRRLRCNTCNKTFLEPVPNKHERWKMTQRLVEYILRQNKKNTEIAREVGINEKTVREVLKNNN